MNRVQPSSDSRYRVTIPIPLFVIDDILPTLRDTELRVLLVVLRQTANKERDWLSSRQLHARTGRSSDAVSTAVDFLVRKGLIAVTGSDGVILDEPTMRRQYRRRQFFERGTRFQQAVDKSKKTKNNRH